MKKKKRWRRILVVLLLLAAAGGWFASRYVFTYRGYPMVGIPGLPANKLHPEGFSTHENGRVQYAWEGQTARTGIDVSSHQGTIDWKAVAGDGVEFAIIRVGFRGYDQGELNMDKTFAYNIKGALDAGLEVGAYFFSQAITPQEAVEEADFVLEALEGYDLTYPVVFDWEPIKPGKNARTDGLDGKTLTECARAFCDRIRAGGREPMVYTNQDMGYLSFRLYQLTGIPLWLAEYDTAPDFYYAFRLWQYSNTGKVAGIKNQVDLNLDFQTVTLE